MGETPDEITMLTLGYLLLLPRFSSWNKNYLIKLERSRHFTCCNKVPVVNRVKGATHHTESEI